MSTPFTSGFTGDKVAPLKFWTHKILPLVYEESLSYYEVLCKVAQKLNETIESVNLSTEEVTHIREVVEGIRDAVDAINKGMVKSVNGKYPDADGGVIVDAPSIPMNPPLIIAGQNRNYLQEAISALIMVYGEIDDELHEYMRNSAPYLVQIVNVGGTPELTVTGAEYDEMVQNVSEHGKEILVSFPDDEYTYNDESYRMYPQIGKLITNGVLEVSRVVSIAGACLYEQYRFDRNGYISYERRNCPDLPVAPSENNEYVLVRTNKGLQWGTTQAIKDSIDGLRNSAPYLVQIVNVGGTPELTVTGAEYDEMVQNVSEHGKEILVSFPDDEYTYNDESYRMYPQIGKLITNGVLEVSRVVSIAGACLYEQYRFDRNGYISYERRNCPDLPVAPSENGEYALVRTATGLNWVSVSDTIDDVDTLNQYWKPTVLPITYTPSNGSANPIYSVAGFHELVPTDEGAIIVEIRVAGQAPVHVQGYYVPGDAEHFPYVHAIIHERIETKNILRVFLLYPQYVNVLNYDLEILKKAVLTVNGLTPNSAGAVNVDATNINMDENTPPVTVHDEVVRIGEKADDSWSLGKGLYNILYGAPQDGQRYKLIGVYDETVGGSVPQWVIDTLAGLVQSVNGQRPDSTGAVSIDGTNIMLGATPTPISVQGKIVQMDTKISKCETDIKGVTDILTAVPTDGRRYKLTATYSTSPTRPSYQWVLDE